MKSGKLKLVKNYNSFTGFSVRLFCFYQAKTLCRYGCMYFLAALVLVCVDVMVMSSAEAMT